MHHLLLVPHEFSSLVVVVVVAAMLWMHFDDRLPSINWAASIIYTHYAYYTIRCLVCALCSRKSPVGTNNVGSSPSGTGLASHFPHTQPIFALCCSLAVRVSTVGARSADVRPTNYLQRESDASGRWRWIIFFFIRFSVITARTRFSFCFHSPAGRVQASVKMWITRYTRYTRCRQSYYYIYLNLYT